MRQFGLIMVAMMLTVAVPTSLLAGQDGTDKKSNSKQKDKNPLPPYSGPKKRLAIVDFDVKSAPATDTGVINNTGVAANGTTAPTATANAAGDLGTGLSEMLATSLQDSNRFILLERKAMADITAEQQISAGAAFDATSASKPGQMLGAQFLIRGTVDEFGNTHTNQSGNGILNNLGITSDKSETFLKMDVRIYEVATGVLLDSVSSEGRVKASSTGLSLTIKGTTLGQGESQTSPMAEAARRAIADAVKKICLRLDRIAWEGHVADLDSTGSDVKYLYIGIGTAGGLKVGQHYSIYHPGRTIVDPDTKVVIGRTKDTLVGHGVMDTCTEKLGTIAIADGTGFAVGDIVKWDDAPIGPTDPGSVKPANG